MSRLSKTKTTQNGKDSKAFWGCFEATATAGCGFLTTMYCGHTEIFLPGYRVVAAATVYRNQPC